LIYQQIDHQKINSDQDRIAQVVINFLTNAIKYAPDSYDIIIRSEVHGDAFRVSVIDKGIGLSLSDQEKVFKRFYRSEGTNQTTFPGFGIGLYIAADIIEQHRGNIGVESKIGEGSTFYFELPIHNELKPREDEEPATHCSIR